MDNVSYFCRDWYPRCSSPLYHWPKIEDVAASPDDQQFFQTWQHNNLDCLQRPFRNIIINQITICKRRLRGSCLISRPTITITAWWDVYAQRTWPIFVSHIKRSLEEEGRKDIIVELVDTDWLSRSRVRSSLEKGHPLNVAFEDHILPRIINILDKNKPSFGRPPGSVIKTTRIGYHPKAKKNPVYISLYVPNWSGPWDWEEPRRKILKMLADQGFVKVGLEFSYKGS